MGSKGQQVPRVQRSSDKQIYQFSCRAEAKEFSKICIGDAFGTILTLGLRSSRTSVRMRTYLYENTYLNGVPFRYEAPENLPESFTQVRMATLALILAVAFGGYVGPLVSIPALILLVVIIPWLVIGNREFHLANSSYGGVKFSFHPDVSAIRKGYWQWILFSVMSLSLTFPFGRWETLQLITNQTRFGNTPFEFKGKVRPLYFAYFMAIGVIFAMIGVMVVLSIFMQFMFGAKIAALSAIVAYMGLLVAQAFWQSEMMRYRAQATRLGRIQFKWNMKFGPLAFLYITNFVACVFTLGLAIPWAVVRARRFTFSRLQVIAAPEDIENPQKIYG